MSRQTRLLVMRDTASIYLGIVALVILALWGAWHVDASITRTTLVRIIAVIILAGFVLFTALFLVLLWSERQNHYSGERTSRLHLPLMISTAALMSYFGIASINAVDVYYQPADSWPLLRDPTVQLITALLILVIVGAKAWMLYEILPHRTWKWRKSP